jgi:4-amino-4-deoxy-L-arabinose transferase-like glycosyltransferase
MKRRLICPSAFIVAIVAIGFGLRLVRLDSQSLWYDEAFSAEVAEKAPSRIIAGDFGDNHPPFHSVALHFWGLMGRTDFVLRLLSALAGTLGIGAIYTLGRFLFGTNAGLLAAAITAMAPYQVFYSQEVRMYSILFLATTILLITYAKALSSASTRWWLAFGCTAIWGMYVQYWIAFVLLGLHIDLLLLRSQWRRAWPRLALADAFVVLAFAPWLNVFINRAQVIARGEFWLERPTLGRLLSAPYAFTLSKLVSDGLVPLAFVVVLFAFIVTHLQAARALARRASEQTGLRLTLSTFWSPLLLTFIVSQWRSVYLERTLIVAVPALYLLLSWGAVCTRERYVNLALLALVGLFAANALRNWYFDPDFGKPPFRSAAELLKSGIASDAPILHANDTSLLPFLHYDPTGEHWLLKEDPILNLPLEIYQSLGAKIASKSEVSEPQFWLVLALDSSVEYQRELVEWFDQRYTLIETHDVDGIHLRQYHAARADRG